MGLYLVFLITLSVAYADSRSFTEFTYDEAGNLTGIASDVSNNPPVITDISPPIVRIGSPTVVTATGTDLRGTAISIDDPGIAIRGISTTNTQAQFTVTAPNNTPLGAHTLTFTTSLGSATGVITVQPRLPTLFISPAPIGVPPTGQPVTLNITLSSTDNIAHTINLLMADTSIATVTPTSVTIPAGSIAPIETVTVQGSTLGSTGLNVSSSILAGASIPVFVTDAFIPPKGDNTFNSLLLGVVLETTPQPVLLERGPFTTKLTIVKGSATTPTDTVVGPVASPDLGITVGNVILGLSPRIFIIGTGPQPLTITGLGLNTATTITAIPPDGITLGPLTPSADGKSATASITVSADAPPTLRQIVVSNAGQTFPPASPDVDRITVAYEGPQVTSIDPIVVALGTTSAVLTIRGRNLQNVRAVNVTPASGMVSVSPQANAQGTIVTTQIEIPENVPLGPRVITVTTDAGTTDTTPSPANTLTIVNALAGDVTPVSAADVGVLVGNTSTPTSRILQLHSNDIGVAIGGVVTGMTPSAQSVGSTFTLTIEGSGLGSVDTVRFERPTGLTVGTPTAAADGKSVSVDVTIAPDAPQVVRTVEAVANGVVMPSSPPSANQFLVTGLLPVVNSITPQFVIKGAAPSVLTVLGQNLDGAGRIQVLPPDGIAVSEPTPSADGNSLIFTVSADVNAALGSRMIIVETPAGQSATIASPANSFAVVNNVVSTVTPVISPVLGVNKEQTSSPPTIDRLLLSPVLGVEIQQSGGPAKGSPGNRKQCRTVSGECGKSN